MIRLDVCMASELIDEDKSTVLCDGCNSNLLFMNSDRPVVLIGYTTVVCVDCIETASNEIKALPKKGRR